MGAAAVVVGRGVYSVGRLRERFEQVEKHVRVAAQVPEGGGLLRHAVAPLLAATVSLNPYHAPTPQELLLDSARRHLLDDDLLTALRDLEQLTGTPPRPDPTHIACGPVFHFTVVSMRSRPSSLRT
jgi:hypothetical protein